MSRIIPPILIGLAVVVWLMYKQLDMKELSKINWDFHIFFWLFMAVFMYIVRHLFYSWRLRIMTDNEFSWPKSMELIVLWEFASSVSPTSIGGSGVALFMLAQEKLSAAKTVSVVLYSMVIDTIFFVVSLPLLYLILGPIMIRPGMESLSDLDGFGYTFLGVILFMTAYGSVFYYGLFVNPVAIKRLLLFISRFPLLKRFKRDLRKTAMDVVDTSKEMQKKNYLFHTKAMVATLGAWLTRFLAINCIIIALIYSTPIDFYNQLVIMARAETMHVTTSFSPTPGSAGIAEYLFGGYFTDYISEGIASLIALVWRIITYYPYLIGGAIIIPVWIQEVMNRRSRESQSTNSE
ncbi:MAG: lysylphosphatidylglycerol synthase transmembrane domain-containing protein [Saprospiraceae bacterium]|nr:lysylphosphatidylglycerol synthase transmembrane domain-containing protein [Saprospiraceae bacterium]